MSLRVSVCTPAHNEEGNVVELAQRVDAVMTPLCGDNWEHIIVDDGSSDRTAELVREQAQHRPGTLRLLQHEVNQGERAAWKTAFDAAEGEVVVMIAADLQSHPEDIPRALDVVWKEGYDVGTCARTDRKDGLFFWAATRVLTTFMRLAFDVTANDASSSFFAARGDLLKNLPLLHNDHRYILAVLRRRGASIKEVGVSHSARTAGATHYSRWKVLKAVPEITRFTARLWRGEFDLPATQVQEAPGSGVR
ncbi:MAG: glycosyltransferase family 2 protein [Myxococcales bacterium]|nr:glycosyltransferase family 2 protein [Myxococcales bacterium]